jgi:Putative DNA-binding domain
VIGLDAEVARQRAVLAALAARTDLDAASARTARVSPNSLARSGWEIYRTNADALAERALGAAFPTLRALLGADDFKHMAREFWRDEPPQRGDIGEWGAALPAWLRVHPGLAPWPYLGDCAELDWLRHCCERALDANLDAGSLSLLDTHEPERLRLLLRPGTALLDSRWPVASLYAAHQADAGQFAELRDAIAEQRGEAVLVARRGWRAAVHIIDAPTLAWSCDVQRGMTLGAALARASTGFDFAHWLAQALTHEWLHRVEVVAGRG